MNNLKLIAKNAEQFESLVYIVRVFSSDIKMEFHLSKCALLVMSRGEVVQTEQTLLPNGEVMICMEDGTGNNCVGF